MTHAIATPHGRGRRRAEDRAELAQGVVCPITMDWAPFGPQVPILAVEHGLILAAAALGAGKSEPGAAKLLMWALRHPRRPDGRPTKWYAIGPEFGLIRQEQFPKILEHCRRFRELGYGELVKRVVYGIDPRIILVGDQVIYGRSADNPDRMRGHEIDGFWGDEVQRWSYKVFRIASSRLRSASKYRAVLTGSPEDSPGWVWRMVKGQDPKFNKLRAQLIESGSGFYCHRWTSRENPTNKTEVLGTLTAIMEADNANIASQELEGRFPGTEEAPLIGLVDYARAFPQGKLPLTVKQAKPESLGVDVGEVDDYTWLTVLSAGGVVLHQERWNSSSPSVPRKTFYPFLKKRVREVAEGWKVSTITIDIAKAGKPIQQELAEDLRDKVTVLAVDTAVPRRKGELIEVMNQDMAGGDVIVPERWVFEGIERAVDCVDVLKKELCELIPIKTGGHTSYTHPPGGHDDGPVSVGLALYGLKEKPDPLRNGLGGDYGKVATKDVNSSPSTKGPTGKKGGFGKLRM